MIFWGSLPGVALRGRSLPRANFLDPFGVVIMPHFARGGPRLAPASAKAMADKIASAEKFPPPTRALRAWEGENIVGRLPGALPRVPIFRPFGASESRAAREGWRLALTFRLRQGYGGHEGFGGQVFLSPK